MSEKEELVAQFGPVEGRPSSYVKLMRKNSTYRIYVDDFLCYEQTGNRCIAGIIAFYVCGTYIGNDWEEMKKFVHKELKGVVYK